MSKSQQERIGAYIKALREKFEMSQTELAEKVGYKDKTSVAKIEAGKVDLPQSKLLSFSKALHTTPSDFLAYVDEDTPVKIEQCYYLDDDARDAAQFLFENPDYKVLFDASRNVKKEDIEFVKQMIDRMSGRNDE